MPNGFNPPVVVALTRGRAEALVLAIGEGLSIAGACRLAGVSYDRFKHYRREASKAQAEVDAGKPEEELGERALFLLNFMREIAASEARAEQSLLQVVREAAMGYTEEVENEVYERGRDGEVHLVERRVKRTRKRDVGAAQFLLTHRHGYKKSIGLEVKARDLDSMSLDELRAYEAELARREHTLDMPELDDS